MYGKKKQEERVIVLMQCIFSPINKELNLFSNWYKQLIMVNEKDEELLETLQYLASQGRGSFQTEIHWMDVSAVSARTIDGRGMQYAELKQAIETVLPVLE
jgi:hypothetical protein